VNERLVNTRHRPNRWRIAAQERGTNLVPWEDFEPDVLEEPPPRVPIVEVKEDDPMWKAAVAEANSRFNEFVIALADRTPSDTFAVKAPFTDDFGREYMWVAVSNVDGSHIYGRLDNDPARVRTVKRGQPVKVSRSLLNDWLIVRGDVRVGGFTVPLSES
jgi:uncharacterized protein YegJ (DUF2314 family)